VLGGKLLQPPNDLNYFQWHTPISIFNLNKNMGLGPKTKPKHVVVTKSGFSLLTYTVVTNTGFTTTTILRASGAFGLDQDDRSIFTMAKPEGSFRGEIVIEVNMTDGNHSEER
jgi:hypothetical protein